MEVLAAKLLPALQKRGFEFAVVAPQNSPDLNANDRYEGIPIHRFPFALARGNIQHLFRLRQQVAKLKHSFAPHLVHINAVGTQDFFHLITASAHSAPLLVTLHGEWPTVTKERDSLVERTLRAADWVVGCSSAILEKGIRLVPEIDKRSSVIYNAIDPPDLAPSPLVPQKSRLLCLGRLVADKGFDVAVKALALLASRFPDLHLTVAGDGPERRYLESQAAELGVRQRIHFSGWLAPEKVPALLDEATILLMPSRRETFGLVALEAALMERPVIATRVGGIPEIVIHEETGLLVESEDSRAFADGISFLLDNPSVTIRMSRTARQRAEERFRWQTHVEAYEALYQRLTNDLPAI